MNARWRSIAPALLALVAALAGTPALQAQQVRSASTPVESSFIRTKNHVINPAYIERIDFARIGNERMTARVYFAGRNDPLILYADEAEFMQAAIGESTSGLMGKQKQKEKESEARYRLFAIDEFDGKFTLNWKPVRPDPSHYSLTQNPGKLTITTQRGSIHGEEMKDEFGAGIAAKNLFLIDNPLAETAVFVVTTCVSGFTPVAPFHQAALIVYDDDDNYLKFGYEYNWPKEGGQMFCRVTETSARPAHDYVEAEQGLTKFWLRLTKRGDRYAYSSSLDGKAFREHGAAAWGNGAPKRIGLLAKNGGTQDAGEQAAAFEFFELRSPLSPAAEDPVGQE